MSDFTPIETQEEFDKAIKARLAQKDRELAEKYKDFKSPDDIEAMKADFKKQLEDANKSVKDAQEKLKSYDTTVAELTKKAETAEVSRLKTIAAIENHIPMKLVERISGTTEEEIKADAQAFSEAMKDTDGATAKKEPPMYIGKSGADSKNGDKALAGMGELLQGINAQLNS